MGHKQEQKKKTLTEGEFVWGALSKVVDEEKRKKTARDSQRFQKIRRELRLRARQLEL